MATKSTCSSLGPRRFVPSPVNVRGAQCPRRSRPVRAPRPRLNQTDPAHVLVVQVFPLQVPNAQAANSETHREHDDRNGSYSKNGGLGPVGTRSPPTWPPTVYAPPSC